jgi:hypothetical protein
MNVCARFVIIYTGLGSLGLVGAVLRALSHAEGG